ncbi:MAG: cupin domain-containing protein [Alphaproteobacteria bacterium]|nr:cupin domain-containing protein [Alphaproteobacteria bacterium]
MSSQSPIVNINDVELRDNGNSGRYATKRTRITDMIGMQKLACSLYTVAPGKTAFPYHAHANAEELCIILEGECTLRQDGIKYDVKAGDIIAAPVTAAHQLVNTSDQELKYLCVASNESVDVVLYPDSNKIGALASGFDEPVRYFAEQSAAVDYYKGET